MTMSLSLGNPENTLIFLTVDRVVQYCQVVAGVSSQLLGVALTVGALVPTLVAAIRSKGEPFFSQKRGERSLRRLLGVTAASILCCGLSLISSIVGQFDVRGFWLWIAVGLLVSGIVLLISVSVISIKAALQTIV
jgi:hypothetical protein